MKKSINTSIEKASKVIGKTWPLYTFVASNPLSGYENQDFMSAVSSAEKHFNANAFPSAKIFNQAWGKGAINKAILEKILSENGFSETPEFYLNKLLSQKSAVFLNDSQGLDRIMAKWLAAFMDEGLAEWDMPYKSEGFYAAWRLLACYDSELGSVSLKEIPKSSDDALEQALEVYSTKEYEAIFTKHLAALPGWTGYINHRTASDSDWQKDFPISLKDYLAVRLWISKKLNIPIWTGSESDNSNTEILNIKYSWLKAWEQTWQKQLAKTLDDASINTSLKEDNLVPDAQMVFCIDTRSELIRRHVESKGNYETFGYAGFFGIAMDYESLDDGISRKSCPPIVNSAYQVTEQAQVNKDASIVAHRKKIEVSNFSEYFFKRMKNMLPSAFGYVEGSGFFYGLSLIARTLLPKSIYKINQKNASNAESIYEPNMSKSCSHDEASLDISLEEKVGIVKSGFDLMGWKQFAKLVLFVGHGSHSANNPFSSSLDCGACAASPGRHNARMLAKLANMKDVRKALNDIHSIDIPNNTVFIGAEHNTTTDDIVLFDSEVPSSHKKDIEHLKANLKKAQETATQDRLGDNNSVSFAQKKANNWSETRPEWGLAKNAGFIVGPRSLTKDTNLDSGCFLHSYDWKLDAEGKALEGIMQGPMVVTQWINNHYYFSTVDNNTYGGGSKITHNITGKFGVVQGNGGDLKMGLPLQSLFQSDEVMYHKPLRLSVVIQAPTSRVLDILLRNDNLKSLLDNEWIYLMIMDPEKNNEIVKYDKSLKLETALNALEPVLA